MDISNIVIFSGKPAICGLIGLAVFALAFKRPYIAIAGGVLGALVGLGFNI